METYTVHLRFIGKLVVDFLFVLIELFTLVFSFVFRLSRNTFDSFADRLLTVVEDRHIMSAGYRIPVIFGQNCPKQQSHGLFATAKLPVCFSFCQLTFYYDITFKLASVS